LAFGTSGELHEEADRILASFFAIRRQCMLENILWTEVSEVVELEIPVNLKLGDSEFGGDTAKMSKDVFTSTRPGVLDDLLDSSCLEKSLCVVDLLEEWAACGVHIGQLVRAETIEGRQRAIQAVVCIFVAEEFLTLLFNRCIHTFGFELASKGCNGKLGKFFGNPSKADDVDSVHHSGEAVSFDHKWFEAAARRLRAQEVDNDELVGQKKEIDILSWLDAMGEHSIRGLPHMVQISQCGKCRVTKYCAEALVQCLRISGLLRNNSKLRQNVDVVGQLFGWPKGWMHEEVKVPSIATLSRHRFTCVAALCKLVCQRLLDWVDNGTEFHVSLGADSSPRGGREWMFAELFIIKNEDLLSYVDCMEELEHMRMQFSDNQHPNFPHDRARECAARMAQSLWHVVLVPMCMGAKNMALAIKYSVIIHGMRLFANNWAGVQRLAGSIRNICTDMGTESSLGKVPIVNANMMFPSWSEDGLINDSAEAEDVQMLPPCLDDGLISFQGALQTPGAEHLCHTIMEKVVHSMDLWKWWYKGAKELNKLLHGKYYADRLAEICFTTRGSEIIRERVYAFSLDLYEARFGSVADWLTEVLTMKSGLQQFYDPVAFGAGERARDAGQTQEGDDHKLELTLLNAVISSNKWWGMGVVILSVIAGYEEVRNLSRGCPCHRTIIPTADKFLTYWHRMRKYREESGQCKPCPSKGLVSPEFATGKPLAIVEKSYKNYRSMVMMDLVDISGSERNELMVNFDHAVSAAVYNTQSRLGDWHALPLKCCSLAHVDLTVARQHTCMARDMFRASTDAPHHPISKALFEPGSELNAELNKFLDEAMTCKTCRCSRTSMPSSK